MGNEIDFKDLVHSPDIIQSYEKDPLRHSKIAPRLFLGMKEGFVQVKKYASDLTLPTLLQLAGQEKLVSNPASREVFERLGSTSKKCIEYPDSYHEIYVDQQREQVIQDLVTFLEENL